MSWEYTEQERSDLVALGTLQAAARKQLRSGHPGRKAEGKARLKAIAAEVAQIHGAAFFRARIGVPK